MVNRLGLASAAQLVVWLVLILVSWHIDGAGELEELAAAGLLARLFS